MGEEAFILSIQFPGRTLELWEELGLDNDMRKEDTVGVQNAMIKLTEDYTNQLKIRRDKTRKEIEDVQKAHKKVMLAYGITQDEINKTNFDIHPINLLQQLAQAKDAYENFRNACAERLKKFENLIHMAVDHFNMLGIPEAERGDYAVLGDDDYSRERLERLKLKVEDLQKEIEEKRLVADDIKNEIYSIQKELSSKLTDQEEAVLNSPLLTPEVIEGVRNLLERLQQAKAHRVKEFEELALNITHLWDTLNVSDSYRKTFLEKYATISDEVYEGCKRELAKLQKQMDEKLPTLIKAHHEQLTKLYDYFHIPPEGRLMIDENLETGPEAVKVFQQMDEEIVRLKKLSVKLGSLVSLINQAEQIKKDYDDVLKNHDPKNYTARDTDSAKILVFEERARRRYKVTLPSLIDKLKKMLDKFRKDNGYDFEWDGRPYIEKLKEDEQQEVIEKKMGGKITECGSVPQIKRKGKKGDDLYRNENMNDNRGNSVRAPRR